MSVRASGFATCDKGERYIKQLTSHWSHKFPTFFAEDIGTVQFSDTDQAHMAVAPDGIAITLTTADAETNLRLREVIEKHLDRFAFREGALVYDWTEK